MGKYMKKTKITSDVKVVTEGVRTRARAAQAALADSSSYIQLRSRPIEKPPVNDSKKFLQKQPEVDEDCCFTKKLSSKKSSKLSNRSCSVKLEEEEDGNKAELLGFNCETAAVEDFSIEGSFGDNYLDCESRDNSNNYNNRSTRETTPCNLIRNPDTIVTPGSTTRRMGSAANNLRRDNLPRNIPTTNEMEEFFACAEHRQLTFFTEKYNFDVVNEKPLPGGRYDWF